SGEPWKLAAVVGTGGVGLLGSGDKPIDQEETRHFIEAYADRHHIERTGDSRATLVIGPKDWPLPIPLVRDAAGWHFDAAAAARQVTDRRIGRNEIGAIRGLLALAEAQRAFHDAPDGPHTYALKLVSAHGQHNGLFWPEAANQPRSPLADVANLARAHGYVLSPTELPESYDGYHLRLLTAAGPNAPGGARSFLDGGHLTGGFAYLAWPVRYGATGLMTFLLGPDGTLFQKDLGPRTDDAADTMKTYDPDLGWTLLKLEE
ncbi:MAG TPA: DUF2950 family protein, partial [Acetobacteraceae bacterium]|nr:DUF2950 family protein [Acetobacteraceae bacterium]